MPLACTVDTASGWIALWRITETEEELARLVRPDDVAACHGIGNPRRRSERLAWRAIVRQLLPRAGRISYDSAGAPRPEELEGYIGVSHCRGYAAVIYSSRPCAIDIEEAGRDFHTAAERYLSPQEKALPEAGSPEFEAAVWCAKETLYKLSGMEGLDLREDIRILSAEFSAQGAGKLSGTVRGAAPVRMELMRREDIILAFTA